MRCKNCGERMEGDGFTQALHCPDTNDSLDGLEPDADAVYCRHENPTPSSSTGRRLEQGKEMIKQYLSELEEALRALERGDFEINYPREDAIADDGSRIARSAGGEKPYLSFAGMLYSSLAAHVRELISAVNHLTFNLEAARKEVDRLKHVLHPDNLSGRSGTDYTHVDDWIDYHRSRTDNESYAKFVLNYFRMPASRQFDFHDWMKQFKLFCTYQGKRYRVTGASRMGDIWLAVNPNQETGYDLRVSVKACSQWSDDPAEGGGMKPYKPPKHLREDEIDRLPKLISIDTRYVKPLENAVREDLREAEKRRRSGEQK